MREPVVMISGLSWASAPEFSACLMAVITLTVRDTGMVHVTGVPNDGGVLFESLDAALQRYPKYVDSLVKGYERHASWFDPSHYVRVTRAV